MKKISVLLLIICFLICSVPINSLAEELQIPEESTSIVDMSVDANSAVESGSFSLDALNPLLGTEKIVKNVRSAIVYEANSQTLMYAWDPDTQMYPASLVKLLTALIAVEKGSLDDVVTVSQEAISSVPHDAVSAKLLPDEKLTLEDLLYCILLGSANDAAAVVAEHISGSQNAFVSEMNRYAQELGCADTTFTNVHGLHDDNQKMTARDCARILDAALKNEAFKTIFVANEYTVKATNLSQERFLANGNSMKDNSSKLYYDARVIGGRTGVAQDGTRCLASAAENNGMLVITVVMGSESVYQEDGYSAISIGSYKETSQLLDTCLSGYKIAQILRAEQVLRQIPVEGADNDLLVGPQIAVSTILPEDITITELSFRYADQQMILPIQKGQYVSDVQVWHDGKCVAQAQLFALNSLGAVNIDDKSVSDKPAIPVALWIIIGLVIIILIACFLIRSSSAVRLMLMRMRKKRNRRNRKRAH